MSKSEYAIYNFSLSLPGLDEGKNDPVLLLEHLTKTLREDYKNIKIQDIVYHTEGEDEEYQPYVTVYYYR